MKHYFFTLVTVMFMAAFPLGASNRAGAAPVTAPYGSWQSPITAEMLVQGAAQFGDISLDGDTLYWVESRPEEEGRYVVMRLATDGEAEEVLPKPYSARTTVHEYGGGALLASAGTVYFFNYADQRLWRMLPGEQPQPLTAAGRLRFAEFVHDEPRGRLIAVCEDHSHSDDEPANRIVAVDLESGEVTSLVEGADFYSTPRIGPGGRSLAWLSWNHPNMPWDGTELFVAEFKPDGSLGERRKVAGGEQESIFQPAWAPDGTLYFVSDRSNWWNLYAERLGPVAAVLPMDAEFGAPQWVFGAATYGFDSSGKIVARYTQRGHWRIARIEPGSGRHSILELPYTAISNIVVGRDHAYMIASSPTEPDSLIEIDISTGKAKVIRRGSPYQADANDTSIPQAIEFPTDDDKTAHAFYYPPKNSKYRGPDDEAPPLIVMIHGGPTSATAARFRLTTQYWTTRGFAVCDVNYGGSTGYGREYRNRLYDSWGLVDVADAAHAALDLASQGKADRRKLIIRGGSAGGYTTLACLAFRDEFCCGTSLYGISDLALMVRDTHKFESRYLDRIVGRWPHDEARYRARSPIHHLEGFDRPVLLLQGLEDKIVPPNQAELILDSLKQRGVPVAYIPFAGEQHGFRKAETIIRAYEAELYFYSRVLGFSLPESIEPVEIFNLSTD